MAKPGARIAALQAALGIGLLLVVGRAGWLQLVRGRELARQAKSTRMVSHEIDARRGTIFDRNGTPLARSMPKYHLQLAVNEVKDTSAMIRRLRADLRIPADSARRLFRPGPPRYPYFPGPFTSGEVAALRGMPGIHLITVYARAYPSQRLAGPIVGALGADGRHGQSGLERWLDSLLAGEPGQTTDLRDPSGGTYESPGRLVRDPVPGNDVYLTLDAELQEIAERALGQALTAFKAEGGDVVFLDPRSGDLLALASVTAADGASTASVFTGAFQPGSTAKPFTAAALLAFNKVDTTETVSGENGRWIYETSPGHTRKIEDTHAQKQPLTLARAIQVSSNIGMAKFSFKLRHEEQYEMLRAFGFGAPTGVEFPSEASGVLRRPDRWDEGYTAQSLAMGYELQVTPVQLAAAYGALANRGLLLAPTLIREIRSVDGQTLYRHQPEAVRRVVPPAVAASILGFLAEAASDSGTGSRAQLRYGILGKTGTAKIAENGRYLEHEYRASFAAIFPAKDPQLVAVVTINKPHGEYYGGLTAAPLTADMLRQALAARGSAIDRSALADQGAESAAPRAVPAVKPSVREETQPVSAAAVRLPVAPPAPSPSPMVEVPDVTGRTLRAAVFALHQRGLRVRVEGGGVAVRSLPAAGDSLPAGKLVVVYGATGLKLP
jgi:cell division protein FtsI (penicillin-binding protein 3)